MDGTGEIGQTAKVNSHASPFVGDGEIGKKGGALFREEEEQGEVSRNRRGNTHSVTCLSQMSLHTCTTTGGGAA